MWLLHVYRGARKKDSCQKQGFQHQGNEQGKIFLNREEIVSTHLSHIRQTGLLFSAEVLFFFFFFFVN